MYVNSPIRLTQVERIMEWNATISSHMQPPSKNLVPAYD